MIHKEVWLKSENLLGLTYGIHCKSLAMLSADDVISDIFTLNTVGVMTQELLKSLFVVQRSNQPVCLSLVITMQFQTKQVHLLFK